MSPRDYGAGYGKGTRSYPPNRRGAHPLVEGGGAYRPQVHDPATGQLVDLVEYVREHGHGPNGPRPPDASPPYDLVDGPLPGQSFEEWLSDFSPDPYNVYPNVP